MKLSISLPDDDVLALDEYARRSGLRTRSAAVRQAIRLLSHPDLEEEYEAAWDEWGTSEEHRAWEATAADGLDDAAR